MRVGILTSIEPRHQHFVRRVCAAFDVAAVVLEDTGYSPARTDGFDLTADDQAIVAAFYAERTRQERLMVERSGALAMRIRQSRSASSAKLR